MSSVNSDNIENCIQWRLYVCNNSNIIYEIKKIGWGNRMEEEKKLEKNMAIKLRRPTELFK